MLPKQYRLKNSLAFTATYNQRNIISDDYVCVYFGKQKADFSQNTKIAFVVSKKIHKRAVIRNRIKRLMRESVRLMLKNSKLDNINKYMSVICVAKSACIDSDFKSVNDSLTRILSRI